MPKCNFCKKKSSCILLCKWCNLSLCTRCIDMTIHECKNINEYKTDRRKSLESNLVKLAPAKRLNL